MKFDLAKIEKSTVDAVQDVGHFIRHEGANFDHSRIEQKDGFNNLVSYVDKESERRLVSDLSKIIPDSGFLAKREHQ